MTMDPLSESALDYCPTRYGHSKLLFRGPGHDLGEPYIAFLGGTETYGKYVRDPFVTQLDTKLAPNCVNFGCINAGIDVFLNDPLLPHAAREAHITVLQVLGAQNMSNRLYQVHPRRNDRFVVPTSLLRSIYPEVDYAAFNFTKHLLAHLHTVSEDRYKIVQKELHAAWKARMTHLIERIDGNIILLWVSDRTPDDADETSCDPLHVTRDMLDHVKPMVTALIEVQPSPEARAKGNEGKVYNKMEEAAAKEIIGPRAHTEIANRLMPVLEELL